MLHPALHALLFFLPTDFTQKKWYTRSSCCSSAQWPRHSTLTPILQTELATHTPGCSSVKTRPGQNQIRQLESAHPMSRCSSAEEARARDPPGKVAATASKRHPAFLLIQRKLQMSPSNMPNSVSCRSSVREAMTPEPQPTVLCLRHIMRADEPLQLG